MPCSSDGYDNTLRYENTITRLACDRCRDIEARGGEVPEWAQAWWTEHQKHDAKRQEREAQEKVRAREERKALAKLTPEERKALGV